ncbi:molybdopterin-dependent oxidoreductase [Mucilaginibacter auburnensis]|uniref:Molybdopterin-dependent oxidoreductase-like protein n=1 Tax=Mucilaginibacter auburnensis TaxID=1457233 RepID=A0A2H9VPF2_9SPHI|nr:molybdopterin-dependent oxidoreductase [Mucilaginibacter auburnensis]PJJ80182.1 molybdopterin-dependent oxidoreductase-like protein [Mucilaginibacter auburnensis]
MQKLYTILIAALFFVVPGIAIAQTIKITGEVTTPLDVDKATFQKFTQVSVKYKDKNGKEHTYTGVSLYDILQKAGVTLGPTLRGQNLTKYVLAEAIDGYHVVFALVELDKEFTDKQIILADKVDGAALPTTEGSYRIIVPDDKKAARSIRQVTGLKVAFAK